MLTPNTQGGGRCDLAVSGNRRPIAAGTSGTASSPTPARLTGLVATAVAGASLLRLRRIDHEVARS